MEHTKSQKQINLPVLQRLDRLEHLLNYIEAQKNLPVPTEEAYHECNPCKDLSTVLEEIPLKGSLLERVTSLEHRVMKLTLGLEEERQESFINSTISSFRCTLKEKQEEDKQTTQNGDHQVSTQEKELKEKEKRVQDLNGKKRQRKSKRNNTPKSRYRKWLTSIPTWC